MLNRKKQGPNPSEPAAGALDLTPLQQRAAAMKVLEDHHDDAEQAAACMEKADALRATIAGTVETAEADLGRIQDEAARAVNEAKRVLADAQQHAAKVEREAEAVHDTGRNYQIAANLAGLAAEARRKAEALAAERQDALGTADAIGARLSELRSLEQAATADLTAARDAGDVDKAGEAKTRLTGVQEVMPTLAAQQQVPANRARAIGTADSGGEYAAALAAAARFDAEREGALDRARPERVEARYVAQPGLRLVEMLTNHPEVVKAWVEQSAPKGEANRQITVHRDGSVSGRNIAHTR